MADSFDYSITNSENTQTSQANTDDAPSYTKETGSRNAEILKSIINDTEYTDAPQSEIEELLLELKEKIAGGGGGGKYSTDEQVVGTWIDGSTIYQKTYVFNQSILIPSHSYADITQEVPDYVDMDNIINAFVTSNSKAADSVWCGIEKNAFCLYCAEGINADTLTIQYTKV